MGRPSRRRQITRKAAGRAEKSMMKRKRQRSTCGITDTGITRRQVCRTAGVRMHRRVRRRLRRHDRTGRLFRERQWHRLRKGAQLRCGLSGRRLRLRVNRCLLLVVGGPALVSTRKTGGRGTVVSSRRSELGARRGRSQNADCGMGGDQKSAVGSRESGNRRAA